MLRRKVLFICVHNSARSQMAAALLNKIVASSSKRTALVWNLERLIRLS